MDSIKLHSFRQRIQVISQEPEWQNPEEFDTAMGLFWDLARDKKLVAGDVTEVARLLNNATRLTRTFKSCESIPQHMENFRQLYITGKLPPHPRATLHLIGMYENIRQYHLSLDIGAWAIRQDENHIDLSTVGMILPILALIDTTTQRYEELSRYALRNIPHGICPYDLSHGAILPDRSKHVNVGGAKKYLECVLNAQLIVGDWRNAYLTLDTIFRNFPLDPPQTALDNIIEERPLFESYQVFFMFTRTGTFVRPKSLVLLLGRLNSAQRIGGDLGLNIDLARAMFRLLENYVTSKGEVDARHLDVLLVGVLSLLYRSPIDASPSSERNHNLEHKLIERLLHKLFDFFAMQGVPEKLSTYCKVIDMGGRLRREEMLHSAWQGLINAGFLANASVYETMIVASGELQLPDVLRAAWAELCQKFSGGTYQLRLRSWRVLANAARKTGQQNYVADQVDLFGNNLSGDEYRAIQRALTQTAPSEGLDISIPDSATPSIGLQRVESIRAFSDDMTALLSSLSKGVPKYHFASCKPFIWAWPMESNEQWERELYDEMSLESPENAASSQNISEAIWSKQERMNTWKSTKSPTGRPISELRFLQFSRISKILIQAEVWEGQKQESGQEAKIRENLKNQVRGNDLNIKYNRTNHLMQIIAHRMDLEEEASKHETKEQWRAKVRNLRSPKNKHYLPPLGSR